MEEQKPSSEAVDSTPPAGASSDVPASSDPPSTDSVSESSSTPPTPPSTPSTPPTSTPQQSGKRFPWIIVLILMFLGFLCVAAWYFHTQLQKTTVTAPTPSPAASSALPKQLVIGTDPTFQPMEFMQNGKMVGYDIDLANLLSKQLGVPVVFKNIIFDDLFTALEQKQITMIISAVTINPQRQQKYDFSEQYLNAGQVLIIQKTNNVIKTPADLKSKKIGVQQGTTNETEALKYTTTTFVVRYPDFVQATKALVAGNVDAIITDLPSAQGIVSTNPTLKIAGDPFTNDYYGVVFRKGDPTVSEVNKALDSLRVRGFLTELKHKWLD